MDFTLRNRKWGYKRMLCVTLILWICYALVRFRQITLNVIDVYEDCEEVKLNLAKPHSGEWIQLNVI